MFSVVKCRFFITSFIGTVTRIESSQREEDLSLHTSDVMLRHNGSTVNKTYGVVALQRMFMVYKHGHDPTFAERR